MRWFKLHSEFAHDPKLATFSKSERCDLIDLLCLANESESRGVITLDQEDIAATLTLSLEEYEAFEEKLIRKRIVTRCDEGLTICNWEKRQYEKPSDTPKRVSERVSKHRESKRNADVTPSNALDTDTESDTDTETATDVAVDAAADTPEEIELSPAERYVVFCVKSVRGMAAVSDGDIVTHLREVIANRGSPPTEEAIRQDALKFRDYWNEKRKKQPVNSKWTSWKRAMTEWFSRTREHVTSGSNQPNGRPREPDFSGIESWGERMNELEQRR